MRYHWGLGIGHKYSWSISQEDSSENPLPILNPQALSHVQPDLHSAHSEGPDNYQGHTEAPTTNEAHASGTTSRINSGETLKSYHLRSGDEIEPEETSLNDGLEDLENEDLGDSDWSDE